jgi:hypothetical protein
MRRLVLTACALIAAVPSLADAQARRPRLPPRIEVGIGGGVAGGLELGERDATLRANSVNPAPFRLFSSDTRLERAAFVDVRLGYRVTPRLIVEGTLGVARPRLTSSLSADVENAAPVEASTTLTEYVITAGAAWRFSTSPRRRWAPFVSGGAGVARHVHDGRVLVENGIDGYAGGGVIYSFGSRSGLRLDGRVHLLNGGVAEGQGVSPRGALSGSIFVAF